MQQKNRSYQAPETSVTIVPSGYLMALPPSPPEPGAPARFPESNW